MKYKVGDEVVLKNGKKVEVEIVEEDSFYVVGKKGDFFLTKVLEDNIDHEKTATLNRENYAKYMEKQINDPAYQELLKELSEPVIDTVNHLPHYKQGELEKIVEQRNNDDYTKALMKYGRVEGDNLDAIKPKHYRQGNIDRIEVWYQTYPFEGFRWAMKSHIDKYIHRYESKGGVEDLDKATYFIKRLKEKEMEECSN